MAGCSGTTRGGDPCGANALKGRDVCLAHADAATRESVGFIAANGKAGRPKAPRAVDVLRERIEADIDPVLAPLFEALIAVRTWTDMNGEVHEAPDWQTRLAAARELLDRGYGKPRQATEISGPDGGPIPTEPIEIPDTEEYRRRVQQLAVATLGGVAMNGSNGNGHG